MIIIPCSRMFQNVPECFGMFHVPGFIDGHHPACTPMNIILLKPREQSDKACARKEVATHPAKKVP